MAPGWAVDSGCIVWGELGWLQYPISEGGRKVRDSHFSAQLPSTSTRAHLPRRLAPRLTLFLAVPRKKSSRKLRRWSGQRRRFAAPMRLFMRLPKARTRTRNFPHIPGSGACRKLRVFERDFEKISGSAEKKKTSHFPPPLPGKVRVSATKI